MANLDQDLILTQLKKFFETNQYALAATASIRTGRKIALVIDQTNFQFDKKSPGNEISLGTASNPDFTFQIPLVTLEYLLSQNYKSVTEIGIKIFENILANQPEKKIKVKLHIGVLSLVTSGYFGVLTAGGGELMTFLATKGFANLGKIKDALGRMKQG